MGVCFDIWWSPGKVYTFLMIGIWVCLSLSPWVWLCTQEKTRPRTESTRVWLSFKLACAQTLLLSGHSRSVIFTWHQVFFVFLFQEGALIGKGFESLHWRKLSVCQSHYCSRPGSDEDFPREARTFAVLCRHTTFLHFFSWLFMILVRKKLD